MAHDPNKHFELKVDKFTFRFPKDLQYSETVLWIRREVRLVRLGLSDFAQQRNGDIAFATLTPAGSVMDVGDEIGSIETVKINLSLPSPVKRRIETVPKEINTTK